MNFQDMISLTHRESERAALLRLAAQYYAATQPVHESATSTAASNDSGPDAILDQLMQTIDRQFVNARYPVPSRNVVARMVINYYSDRAATDEPEPPV